MGAVLPEICGCLKISVTENEFVKLENLQKPCIYGVDSAVPRWKLQTR